MRMIWSYLQRQLICWHRLRSCEVAAGVALARMTAIRKPGGGVRGIATGDMFRRLASRSLAAAWAPVFDQATRQYKLPLRTRAGADALSARLRATLENDARATVVALDGRSAYDCISCRNCAM